MGYCILILFSFLILFNFSRGRSISVLVLTYSLISPSVAISGSIKIDSFYFVIILLFVLTLLKSRTVIIRSGEKNFLLFSLLLVIIYAISWLLKARVNDNQFIIAMMGTLKPAITIALIANLCDDDSIGRNETIRKTIKLVSILNGLAILFQILIPQTAYNFFSSLYSSNSSTYYSQDTTLWGLGGFYQGRYTRYFGVFENPMLMACFCSLALCFIIPMFFSSERRKKSDYLYLLILILSGISSTTKTFILSLPIIILLSLFFSTGLFSGAGSGRKSSSKVALGGLIVISAFLCIALFYDDIYSAIYAISPNYAHYFSYLSNPLSALVTRFGESGSSSSGLLSSTIQIIEKNLLIGVGPVSISGEPIGDSSYIVMLHNAGLLGMLLLVIYFAFLFNLSRRRSDTVALVIVTLLCFLGIGLNVMVGANITMFVYYYILSPEYQLSENDV